MGAWWDCLAMQIWPRSGRSTHQLHCLHSAGLTLWRQSGTWSPPGTPVLGTLHLLSASSVRALQPGGVSGTAQGAHSVLLMQQALPWVQQG